MKKFDGKVNEVPADSLAFIGDAVYELAVRLHVLGEGHSKSGRLHGMSIQLAKATRQADFAKWLLEAKILTEKEQALLLRGRNSNPGSMSKNADPVAYRWATGLECLLGYLYLSNAHERIDELLQLLFCLEQDIVH